MDEKGQPLDEIIASIATRADVPEDKARKAASILITYLDATVPQEKMAPLYAAVPGAKDLVGPPKGWFGKVSGGLMGAYAELFKTGLTSAQMQVAGTALLDAARDRAGEKVVGDVIDSVPMLRQLL